MTEPSTKERILEAAESIMLEKGFHSVGLNEILKAVNVPKGSFYHHFDSKENFGVEMLKHYSAASGAYKRQLLLSNEPEANPRARLFIFFDSTITCFLENGGKCPCLIVKLASEVSDFSEPMREVLAAGQKEWASITEQVLREGIEKKMIAPIDDPADNAQLMNNLWIGAIIDASIARDVAPLRQAVAHISENLAPAP